MNKLYHILCSLILVCLLIVGCISLFDKDPDFSEQENRNLKTFPKMSFSALLDGSFAQELVEYYADTFPGREGMLKSDGIVGQLFTFRETEPEIMEPVDTQPMQTE